jgi:hypothetical protein
MRASKVVSPRCLAAAMKSISSESIVHDRVIDVAPRRFLRSRYSTSVPIAVRGRTGRTRRG